MVNALEEKSYSNRPYSCSQHTGELNNQSIISRSDSNPKDTFETTLRPAVFSSIIRLRTKQPQINVRAIFVRRKTNGLYQYLYKNKKTLDIL